jgi:putative salt-induced outer membrane protein YdiY
MERGCRGGPSYCQGEYRDPKSFASTSKAYFLLSKEKDVTNAESLGLESQVDWNLSERFFTYFDILGLRDRFKNYSYRILPSAGAGYKLVAAEKVQLSVSAGLSEVFTKYYDSGETDSYTGIALGNQFTWKISESAELSQALALNSDISELSRYFLRFEASLATALTKGLSVKLTLMDSYDSQPEGEGIKKNDISFLAGLSAKF